MANLADRKRQKIILLTPTYGDDGQGGKPASYIPFATAWGKIEEEQGAETIFQGQNYGTQKVKITIRFQTGINRTHRAQNGNKIYRIIAVRDKNAERQELEIFCTEVQPKGAQ